jgi:hypothetical protein
MNQNLLNFNNDFLNVVGNYVKKDNFEIALRKEEQILNGIRIRFDPMNSYTPYCMYFENYELIKGNNNIKKDAIKKYMYINIYMEIICVKRYAKKLIKLN